MTTYQETPIYEAYEESPVGETLPATTTCTKGHLLVGFGAFLLLAQFIPGNIIVPFAIVMAGVYMRRQQKQTDAERRLTKGHLLIGFGTFLLLAQVIPGNLVMPLAIIAAGVYFLRQQGKPATE